MVNLLRVAFLFFAAHAFAQRPAPSHALFSDLLKKNVAADGRVNYKGFIRDSVTFNNYLRLLSMSPPSAQWTVNEKKAYWINAYNAFTIKLIISNYPVKRMDLQGEYTVGR
jgi:Protein of unknown function, DUF547